MLFKCFFLFLVLMAVLFSGVDPQWQFGRGSSKKHFCEILLNRPIGLGVDVVHLFYFLLWWSKTILAKLVEGLPRNILVKLF